MKHLLASTFLAAFMFGATTFVHADQKENEWVICSSTWVTNFGPTDFHVDAGGTNSALVSVSPQRDWTLLTPKSNPISIPWQGSALWTVVKDEDQADGTIWYCSHPATFDPSSHMNSPSLYQVRAYWTEHYYYSQNRIQVKLHAGVVEKSPGAHNLLVKYGVCECGHQPNPDFDVIDGGYPTHFDKYTWRWDNLSDEEHHPYMQIETGSNLFNPTFYFEKSGSYVRIMVQVLAEWSGCDVSGPFSSPVADQHSVANLTKACHGYSRTICEIIPNPSR